MENSIIDVLQQNRLFSEFDQQLLERISLIVSVKPLVKNEIIFYENDDAYAFYIVVSGRIKVFKVSPEGKEQILMIANKGESFAEAALFGKGVYPASAQALVDSKILVFNKDKFVSLVEKYPSIALKLIARMAELLHKLNKLVEELSLTNITTRLAHYLLEKLKAKGDDSSAPYISLIEKKTVLASQLGTIPETLSRSFAKLTREKIIKVDGARIDIVDLDRLQKLADS